MALSWKQVWESRQLGDRPSVLANLMAADGFDTAFGSLSEESWRGFVRQTAELLGVTAQSSVFEVGCGAGAFLYDLHRAGCSVGGLDASETLIGFARQIMPAASWEVGDAAGLDESQQYDFVISMSVFLYFPNLAYANKVLTRMAGKARLGIAVLDLPDRARQDDALQFRLQQTGPAEYRNRYDGLDHLFFERQWFDNSLRELSMSRIRTEPQCIDGYANAPYRFNAFAWKDPQK